MRRLNYRGLNKNCAQWNGLDPFCYLAVRNAMLPTLVLKGAAQCIDPDTISCSLGPIIRDMEDGVEFPKTGVYERSSFHSK